MMEMMQAYTTFTQLSYHALIVLEPELKELFTEIKTVTNFFLLLLQY